MKKCKVYVNRDKKMNATFLNIKQASIWASGYLGKSVSPSNISYLINYGKIPRYIKEGSIFITQEELEQYYALSYSKEKLWKEKLGTDLNWMLSFDNLTERETTKHVHRLHPYKGKFIPQLVEYFLDEHTDDLKKTVYFHKGDIILDPFCGSGTTLVEANELGINALGIDVSAFNTLMSNCKIMNYDLATLKQDIDSITIKLQQFVASNQNLMAFDNELSDKLAEYNNNFFPAVEFKRMVQQKRVDGKEYGEAKAKEFLPIYYKLLDKYRINLQKQEQTTFIDKWYIGSIKKEIDVVFNEIKGIKDIRNKEMLFIILSRDIRYCRERTQ